MSSFLYERMGFGDLAAFYRMKEYTEAKERFSALKFETDEEVRAREAVHMGCSPTVTKVEGPTNTLFVWSVLGAALVALAFKK